MRITRAGERLEKLAEQGGGGERIRYTLPKPMTRWDATLGPPDPGFTFNQEAGA
jgi:hypothetical protein